MQRYFCGVRMIAIGVALSTLAATGWAQDESGAGWANGIKPPVIGLVSMGFTYCMARNDNQCVNDNSLSDAFSLPNVVHAAVINVTWTQLEPTPGAFNFQAIDDALIEVIRYDVQYPAHPLRAILRVESGSVAPDWVKQLDGGPVSILYRTNNVPITVPLFWTADYQKAWRELQRRLAERYDFNPLVAQVSNTSCAHETDEPYNNPVDSASIIALFNAGYTNQAFENCLLESVHDYDGWHLTPVDFEQYLFQNISVQTVDGVAQGHYGPLDLAPTLQIMKAFRDALGERAIISNHNLAYPTINNVTPPLFRAIQAMGKPIQFQTASPGVPLAGGGTTGNMKNWDASMQFGVGLGATAIEVWPSFTFKGKPIQDGWNPIACNAGVPPADCAGQPLASLRQWNAELEAQALHDAPPGGWGK